MKNIWGFWVLAFGDLLGVKWGSAFILREKDSNDHSWNARSCHVVCGRKFYFFHSQKNWPRAFRRLSYWLDSGFSSAADCGRVKQDRDIAYLQS